MINVFRAVNLQMPASGPSDFPAASPQFTTPVPANADLLLIFNVTTLTGTGTPTLQVVVEQLVAGAWVAVSGGTQAAVSATGLSTYLVPGGFGSSSSPWRIRVLGGGTTITNATFNLSRWFGNPSLT